MPLGRVRAGGGGKSGEKPRLKIADADPHRKPRWIDPSGSEYLTALHAKLSEDARAERKAEWIAGKQSERLQALREAVGRGEVTAFVSRGGKKLFKTQGEEKPLLASSPEAEALHASLIDSQDCRRFEGVQKALSEGRAVAVQTKTGRALFFLKTPAGQQVRLAADSPALQSLHRSALDLQARSREPGAVALILGNGLLRLPPGAGLAIKLADALARAIADWINTKLREGLQRAELAEALQQGRARIWQTDAGETMATITHRDEQLGEIKHTVCCDAKSGLLEVLASQEPVMPPKQEREELDFCLSQYGERLEACALGEDPEAAERAGLQREQSKRAEKSNTLREQIIKDLTMEEVGVYDNSNGNSR